MKLGALIAELTGILASGGVENAANEARWLAEETSGFSGARRAADPELLLRCEMEIRSRAARRCAGEPLQYILGTAPFRDLELEVTPDVLIPRPETETLVDWVLRTLPRNGRLLDLGCGSGAIALAVAAERPDARVTAVDLSSGALAVARRNAARCGVVERIEFRESDLFSALDGECFDVTAANLPYVTEEEYPMLDAEVRDFEPVSALVARDGGLELIYRSVEELRAHLNPGGAAIFELSPPQAAPVAERLAAQGFTVSVVRDLCGRDRFVAGVLR